MENSIGQLEWFEDMERIKVEDNHCKPRYIYILELDGGRYYIGLSVDPIRRVNQHKKSGRKSSAWCKLFKPLRTVSITPIGELTDDEAEFIETQKTLDYMKIYGWRNVRGGYFCNTDQSLTYKNLLSHKKRKTFDIDFI